MTKLFDPLYSRDSKGNIVSWTVCAISKEDDTATISIHEGLLSGRQTPTNRNVKVGKNLNKMNETTPFEQACSESESRWNKKKKQGYKSLKDLSINLLTELDLALPINRTDANNISKPMKAQPYFKDNGEVRIKFPCYGQPKLNGFRVMARWEYVEQGEGLFKEKVGKVVFRSKEGLVYDILEHIEKDFTKEMFFIDGKEIVFDGEMYIHGEILSEISSAVRKRNSKTSKLQFCIFDLAIEGIPQNKRLEMMYKYIPSKPSNFGIIVAPSINNNEEAQTYTDQCIRNNYEGAIFRDIKATYQFGKRPQTMTKLKRSQDKEFKIIDVVGGDNSPELGVFVCLAENGKSFKCTPEGTMETKKEYLSNKINYIGKNLTVRFFERTKEDLPFHAIGTTVRDYE